MTERYFKREYEEEYYIFDSEVMTEDEFDERYDYEGYPAFRDSLMSDEILDKLNIYDAQKKEADKLIAEGVELASENQRLKKEIQQIRTYIDNAILTERTRMGRNALKQLRDGLL